MSSGLYGNIELVERNLASYAAGSIGQKFLAPCDLEIIGLAALIGTAPGAGASITFNVSVVPTSQLAINAGVSSSYSLWTTAVPTISGTATTNLVPYTATTDVTNINKPYALNYPLPGAPTAATSGFKTAQATSTTTNAGAVSAPPTIPQYGVTGLVAPDTVYTGLGDLTAYNGSGVASTPATIVHAGDVLTFSIAAGTGGAGSAAGTVEIVLYANKN